MNEKSKGEPDPEVGAVSTWAGRAIESISSSFYGSSTAIELALCTLLCRGHLLIEDVPGVGKTILARALSQFVGGAFRQIQCTPDLLPADILGVSIFHQASGSFRFREGPIMTNTLLVDEINRATPRTQSALLEAMAEGQVSVESTTMKLPDPFFLIATQSPLESEGTFPLPEVQKDRFFLSLALGYPTREDELRIMADPPGDGSRAAEAPLGQIASLQQAVTSVYVAEELKDYIVELVTRTRNEPRLAIGVSPRGSLALFKGCQALAAVRGRDYVVPEDIKDIAAPVLSNRILFKPETAARGTTPANYILELLSGVPVPGYER